MHRGNLLIKADCWSEGKCTQLCFFLSKKGKFQAFESNAQQSSKSIDQVMFEKSRLSFTVLVLKSMKVHSKQACHPSKKMTPLLWRTLTILLFPWIVSFFRRKLVCIHTEHLSCSYFFFFLF